MRAQRERRSILRVVLSTVFCGGLIAAAAGSAFGQDAQTAPTSRPTSMPTTRVALNFSDASVVSILKQLSADFGFQIAINEASADTRVTVISIQPISGEEALSLLNAALRPKEYGIIRMGMILKLLTRSHLKQEPPVFYGTDTEPGPDMIPDNDDLRTQVMPVGSLDAVKLRQDLTPIMSTDAPGLPSITPHAEAAARVSAGSLDR